MLNYLYVQRLVHYPFYLNNIYDYVISAHRKEYLINIANKAKF